MEENQTQNTSAMRVFAPDQDTVGNAHVNAEQYKSLYADSVADPEAFWAKQGQRLDWIAPFTKVKNVDFTLGNVTIKWFEDGVLNVSANCIDRHLETRGDQTAIIWEPDEPSDPALHITYKELHSKTCKMANVLKSLGVTKGDRVVIYLPMIPEAAYAMLACARIGAIHSIVFAGFSPDALAARISGCDAKVIITADEAPRGGRKTPLKSNADAALLHCKDNVKCLVVKRTGGQTTWTDRDYDYNELSLEADDHCPPRQDERRRSAFHPLYLRLHRTAQGRRAYIGRLPYLCVADP